MKRTTIIILNYRGAEDTIECLSSLMHSAAHAHVIVVENGSTDDSAARIRAAHPWAEVLQSKVNLGFTGGNNFALQEVAKRSSTEFIWLLNNDTVVVENALNQLTAAMDADSRIGILTPQIDYYDPPGGAWFAGSRLDLSRALAVHENTKPSSPGTVTPVPWITGCSMFCRYEAIVQARGFDDRYFLNWEDVDLSLRIQAAGWELKLLTVALVKHKVSRSFGSHSAVATYYSTRNRLLWIRTYGSIRSCIWATCDSLRTALRSVRRREERSGERLRATVRALLDAMLGRYGCRT